MSFVTTEVMNVASAYSTTYVCCTKSFDGRCSTWQAGSSVSAGRGSEVQGGTILPGNEGRGISESVSVPSCKSRLPSSEGTTERSLSERYLLTPKRSGSRATRNCRGPEAKGLSHSMSYRVRLSANHLPTLSPAGIDNALPTRSDPLLPPSDR